MDETVRVGLVGLGRMGSVHAANLAGRIPGARLVRIVDAAEDVACENAARLGGMGWSTRYEDLLEDPEVEAVVVASPTPLHAEMAEAAGYEHTFVHTVKDLLDGIKTGVGPGPTFEDGYRCQAVLDAVERSLENREWTSPEIERTKGRVYGEV